MTAELVERVNKLPYPPTVWSHGWIYGLWYCGTSWQKAIYYGQYPSTFVKRVLAMFPTSEYRMLHLCCGRCHIEGAVNVDRIHLPEVDIVAEAEALPFDDDSFDVVLIDPPYSQADAEKYGAPKLLSSKKVMAECQRVLRRGGWLLWLDLRYPSFSRKKWRLAGLIGVVTGFMRATRVLSMFENLKDVPMAKAIRREFEEEAGA